MLVAARYVVLDARTVLEDAALRVVAGRVARAGPRARLLASRRRGERVRELPDAIVLPGLVNAHVHLELSAVDGGPMRGRPFAEWLRFVVRERRALGEARAVSALDAALRGAVRAGTTAFGEIASAGWSAPRLRRAGVRAVVFEEAIALDPRRAAAAEKALRARLAASGRDGAFVRRGVSPHAPYSVSADLFRLALATAREKTLRVAIHAAETPEEREFVSRGTGPLRAFLDEIGVLPPGSPLPAPFGLGKGPIDVLAGFGALGRRTILAHGNDLSRADVERVARSGAAVVFCPGTHLYFGRPAHPLERLLRAGARVALGTDGLTSNDRLDLFAEMAAAARLFPRLRPEVLFDLATRGGFDALFGPGGGHLRPGAPADLAAVPIGDPPRRPRDLVPCLVAGGPRPARLVFCGGRVPRAFGPDSPDSDPRGRFRS